MFVVYYGQVTLLLKKGKTLGGRKRELRGKREKDTEKREEREKKIRGQPAGYHLCLWPSWMFILPSYHLSQYFHL